MKLFLNVLFIICISSFINVQAYQSEVSGFIILNDGTKEEGNLDINNLEQGYILFEKRGNEVIRYSAEDISGFSEDGVTQFNSLLITYNLNDQEKGEGVFFSNTLIDGTVKLEEIYGAGFDYALTKSGNTNALQRVINSSGFGPTYFDNYKGVFYLAFIDCDEKIKTDNLNFRLSAFIDVIEEYNSCINPDFKKKDVGKEKDTQKELEFSLGTSYSEIDPVNRGVRNYEYGESSEAFLKLIYKSNFPHKNLFFGIGLIRKKYTFAEERRSSDNISFSEVQIPVLLEYRNTSTSASFSAYSGFNLHTRIRGLDNEKLVSNVVGVSLTAVLNEDFEIGISTDITNRIISNDLESENRIDFAFGRDVFIGVFLRYKDLEY